MRTLESISKKICYKLRHNPGSIKLDKRGFADINDILSHFDITLDILNQIVETDDKNRYEVSNNKIRCRQGHSIKGLELDLEEVLSGDFVLYHGTALRNKDSILREGLKPMKREFVHLTRDFNRAHDTAIRYSNEALIFNVNIKDLLTNNIKVLKSSNDVYLVDYIDEKYLQDYVELI